LFHEEEEEKVEEEEEKDDEEEVVGLVVGMEYLVSLADVGMQVSVFSGLGVGGDGIFCVSCGCGDASFSVFSR
jgi:hypothetical protein